jgi:nucleoside-diphosphate-sugar epimerase
MRVLVTGASGFVGKHMISCLARTTENIDLFGISRSIPERKPDYCTYLKGDITRRDNADAVISEIEPEIIINLAGKNHGTLEELFAVNVIGTRNLLDAAHNLRKKPRVLIIGSSAEYGYAGPSPIRENTPPDPVSEYGICKLASTFLSMNFYKVKKMPLAIIRPFNLLGPGQQETFVCGRLVKQICGIDPLSLAPVSLKHLDSRRDFVDVRDAVRAFWMVISHKNFDTECAGKIFNLGSGKSHSVADLFGYLCAIKKRNYPIDVIQEERPDLIPTQVCDVRYLSQTTGWLPSISIEKSLEDMISDEEPYRENR